MKLPSAPRLEALVVALAMAAVVVLAWPRLARAPLEGHSWRQALAANVTRSYACGQPLLEPRVDACGSATAGVQAMELPLYAWFMARADGWFGGHLGERLVALAGALLAVLGLALLARRAAGAEAADPASSTPSLLGRRPAAPPAVGAAPLAAVVAASSALFVFYGATLIPDVTAYGVTLVGAVIATRRSRFSLVFGAIVMSFGIATKLVALPIAAYPAMALVISFFDDRERTGRRLGDLVLYGALVALVPFVWYVLWNRHLGALESCQLFWTKLEHPLKQLGFGLPVQVHVKLGELFGSWWRLAMYLALLLLLVLRTFDALPTLALWAASSVLWAMLGWHHDAHEYDTLMFLPPAALTLGGALGALTGHLKPEPAIAVATIVPLLALGPGAWSARKQLPKREKVEQPALAYIGPELDRLLPPEETVIAPDAGGDARLAYYAARPTFNGKLECASAPADVAVTLAAKSPVCARSSEAVYLPDATITFGLKGRQPVDFKARLAVAFSDGNPKEIPGLGVYLGHEVMQRPDFPPVVALWFQSKRDNLPPPNITGGHIERAPAPIPDGALYLVRVVLAEAGPYKVTVGDLVIEGKTGESAPPPELRCVK